jgi:hypothetical protein
MPASIRVTRPIDADVRWVVRDRIRFMGELEGTHLNVLEVEVPPGSGTPPHRHESPEIFRVLDGEITFGLSKRAHREWSSPAEAPLSPCRRGCRTIIRMPARRPRPCWSWSSVRWWNSSATSVSAKVPPAGPPSASEINAVIAACARHNITILAEGLDQPVGSRA